MKKDLMSEDPQVCPAGLRDEPKGPGDKEVGQVRLKFFGHFILNKPIFNTLFKRF